MIETIEQLRAAVYGQAVGDALGVPYEFQDRDSFACANMIGHGTHNQPAGTWSDDTSMMLATLDSLIGQLQQGQSTPYGTVQQVWHNATPDTINNSGIGTYLQTCDQNGNPIVVKVG